MQLTVRAAEVLTPQEMEKILQAARRIWESVPLRAQGTDEFNQLLRDFGCDIDGELVRFPAPVREKVLARITEERRVNGEGRPAEVSSSKLQYNASGQGLYICDVDTRKLRSATTSDLADFSRLCDMFGDLGRAHPTFIPQDVPLGACDLHAFATIALNSSRPWRVSVYSAEMLPYFIAVQAVCDGSVEAVKRNPVFAAKCWMNSPFMLTAENIEIAMKARKLLGLPFRISIMPVAGTSTPLTIAGGLVQSVAEVLMCNTISLALDDRLMGWHAGPLVTDMRTGAHTQSAPECDLFGLGAAQMGAYIFGGEYTAQASPTTMAKVPGVQAMMEKTHGALWAILNGIRSFGSLGTLACADIGSPVQLMLDIELVQYYERLLAGIAVDEEHLAEDVIREVAPTGARYLDHEHTVRFCRDEVWTPELSDRTVPMAWMNHPTSMLEKAAAKAGKLIAEAPNRCPLSASQRAEIAEIVAEADADVSTLRRG